jgi:type IV pilus assembly protein PilE
MAAREGRKTGCNGGFTLTEVMIVLAVVAVLMAIALPGYQEAQKKARRSAAKTALQGLTIALQRYYTEQSPSTYIGATLGGSGIYPNEAPIDGATKFYNLSITASTATSYTIRATPKNGQAGDDCGAFTLTSLGVKGVTGSLSWSTCWD